MGKFAVFIKTTTLPGKRDDVHRLWEEHIGSRVRRDDAQLISCCCDDNHDPNVMYTFEYYQNRAAFDAISQQPWFTTYIAMVTPLLDGPPEVGFTTPVWVKTVPHDL